MQILESHLLKRFPEVVFGLSTKNGVNNNSPFHFNLSLTVGDDPDAVWKNREVFFNELGLTSSQIAIQRQIHSDIVTLVEKPGLIGESDAMITDKFNVGLAVSTADCVPIFLYDHAQKVVAGIHSGWRGTQQQILRKTLVALKENFGSEGKDIYVYIGPSICQKNYEVGKEVAEQFDKKYLTMLNGKLCLNVIHANYDMVCNFGIPEDQIEASQFCSYEEKELLHSYRRDGKNSGRSLGVIAMKEK
ncbi:peptidoglycan editing factor PgeF [bacterium]|nr:peptidoglycan editing factor PgeF [bacterium]